MGADGWSSGSVPVLADRLRGARRARTVRGMTDVERLAARMRCGWTALLIAAGCTGVGAPVEEGRSQPVNAEAEVEAVGEPTRVGEAGEPTAVARVTAGEPGSEAQPVTKPPEIEKVEVGRPVGRGPTCPQGAWSGPKALAKRLKEEGSAMKDGCPRYVERVGGIALSEGEVAELDNKDRQDSLPYRAIGTLDAAGMKKAAAGQCVYRWTIRCPGGRVLVGDDGVVLAEVEEGAGWAAEVEEGEMDVALADGWESDARMEHASIASFARATLELLAVGAPPALVSATQAASLDEVEHARLCFALASRYSGKELGPGPLAVVGPRSADLVRLACDVFVEGCVGETIAALAAGRARGGCEDVVVSDVLAKIADDEARHAALAWATLGWACERGGDVVRDAVRRLAAVMQREVLAEEDVVDAEEAWLARHGRLGAAGQQACARAAWEALIPAALAETVG
jgi:hypothetical protein